MRLDDRVCSAWFTVEQGLRQGCMLARFLQHLLLGGYKLSLHAFQDGQRHHGRFGTPEEEKGGGGVGEATAGESVFGTPLWDMLYADDVEMRIFSTLPNHVWK